MLCLLVSDSEMRAVQTEGDPGRAGECSSAGLPDSPPRLCQLSYHLQSSAEGEGPHPERVHRWVFSCLYIGYLPDSYECSILLSSTLHRTIKTLIYYLLKCAFM